MSWHFSRALVADYSAHISSDSLRYALSSEMSTVDLFSPSDKTTGIYRDSRFGMTYAHLKEAAGEELLTSYLADSRVRRSQLPLGGAIPQPTFGLKWQESFGKCNRPMCLPRTSPVPQLNGPQAIAPRWVTKPKCLPLARQTWVQTMCGSDIGYLHTPTTKANYAATSMQKWPSARNFVRAFGRPCPGVQEWMMGWPEGWSDTKPLETAKYQSWLRRLCGHWRMLTANDPNSGAARGPIAGGPLE